MHRIRLIHVWEACDVFSPLELGELEMGKGWLVGVAEEMPEGRKNSLTKTLLSLCLCVAVSVCLPVSHDYFMLVVLLWLSHGKGKVFSPTPLDSENE